jgi:hypothetical protein
LRRSHGHCRSGQQQQPAENDVSDGEDELVELDLNGEQRLPRCVGVACAAVRLALAKPELTLRKHRPELDSNMCILGTIAWQ